MERSEDAPRAPTFLIGAAAAACVIVLFAGVLGALAAAMNRDWSGTGLCLLATGLTAGLVLNAVFRR